MGKVLRRQAYKIRLNPTPEQAKSFRQFSGCARKAYNMTLDLQQRRYDRAKKHKEAGREEMAKRLHFLAARGKGRKSLKKGIDVGTGRLTRWKRRYTYLGDAPSSVIDYAVEAACIAYKNFFGKKAKYPRFKSRGDRDSFHYYSGVEINQQRRRVSLPKIGDVPFFPLKNRDIEGVIKNVTISLSADRWYAAIQTEREIDDPVHENPDTMTGVHMGIKRFCTTSDGMVYDGVRPTRDMAKKLAWEQRKLARKKKGSKNAKKQKVKVARVHEAIRNQRVDYQHKLSRELVNQYGTIAMEEIKVRDMTEKEKVKANEKRPESLKGIPLNVMNRSILDRAWFQFRTFVKYKQEWSGGRFVLVDPKENSSTCTQCGVVDPENRKDGLTAFNCVNCGFRANADDVAALNVLRAGYARLACDSEQSDESRPRDRSSPEELAGTAQIEGNV